MGVPLAVGETIASKYRLDRVIGEGGMGIVMAAQHLGLSQPVAIKFLHSGASPRLVERFVREARAAARIRNDHVPQVFDVDHLPSGDPYIVMELLDGEDLSQRIERLGPLSLPEAVSVLLQACEALAHAHRAGIVHRDLKPANLFQAHQPDGASRVKVLDFGISKLRDDADSASGSGSLTRTGAVMGSPVYMAPEQWVSAKNADERSDIWSLGAILYELLVGVPPFGGDGVAQICRSVLDDEPKSLRESRAELPAAIEAVVLKCLSKAADQRYQSVAELALALEPFAPAGARAHVERAAGMAGLAPAAGAVATAPTHPSEQTPPGAQAPSGWSAADRSDIASAGTVPSVDGPGPAASPATTMPSEIHAGEPQAAPAPGAALAASTARSPMPSPPAQVPAVPAAGGSMAQPPAPQPGPFPPAPGPAGPGAAAPAHGTLARAALAASRADLATPPARPRSRWPLMLTGGLLGLLVVALVLGGLLWRNRQRQPRAARRAPPVTAPERPEKGREKLPEGPALTPCYEHAAELVAALAEPLGKEPRIYEITLRDDSAELLGVHRDRPLRLMAVAFGEGEVHAPEKTDRKLEHPSRLVPLHKLHTKRLPEILKDARGRHPKRRRIAYVKLQKRPVTGTGWLVCLGAEADCPLLEYGTGGVFKGYANAGRTKRRPKRPPRQRRDPLNRRD